MHTPPLPLTRDLVLVGGGHTHALVLRKWGMAPLPGTRLTVINPGPTAPYSGMLPGFVAGHYTRDALDIDLIRLARFAGARAIIGKAHGVDLDSKEIHVDGRPPIRYDVASVDVGITSDMPALPGFAKYAIAAKPLGPFAEAWHSVLTGEGKRRVAVIGGGVAGVELVLAMAHALKKQGRLDAAFLIDNGKILTAIGEQAQKRLRTALTEHAVTVLENVNITSVDDQGIILDDDRLIPCDFITGTAGARAYGWVERTGLETESGFIKTNAKLLSSDPNVFATGDCAHFTPDPRPKAGVYAVRQAPILFHNMRSLLSGRPLLDYKPQKDYLKLISMGGKDALGERFGTTLSGALMWKWKNHIDTTFMEKFRSLPEMEQPTLPTPHTLGLTEALGDKPACGGCGSKIGRDVLRQALRHLPAPQRSDVLSLPGDDAAIMEVGGIKQVFTTDHLRPLTPDPVVMTRIAVNHALGDIWAMGGRPQAATVSVTLPRLSPELQERTLSEIMTTAQSALSAAGAEIVGGHSSTGDELVLGFNLTGLLDRNPITLSGAQEGDVLILTKPIGSGTIMAAEMAGQANGDDVLAALDAMSQSQANAADILAQAHAMTDVTGFGLAGHLMGICEASGLSAVVELGSVPLLPGAASLAEAGVRSTLFPANRSIAPELPDTASANLLFDPQTAGGLLAAVSADQADDILTALVTSGYTAARIGTFSTGPARIEII